MYRKYKNLEVAIEMDLVLTHITDIHIEQEADIDILMNRTHSIAGAIFEVIRNPEKTMLILCITGDISYSGTEEQYDIAGLFFDDLFDKLKKDMTN